TKYIWQFKVLPVMASYLGVRYMGYNADANPSAEENSRLKQQPVYPSSPVVTDENWQKIVAYYVDNAPAQSPIDSSRLYRNQPLELFNSKLIPLSRTAGSTVTAIAYDTTQRELWVAEPDKLYRWNFAKGLTHNYELPGTVVDVKFKNGGYLLTDIGTLLPSQVPKGSLFSFADDSLSTVRANLHRPVCSLTADLNGDGIDEIISCNFGFQSGSLSLYTKLNSMDSTYRETVLLNQPGAVKCYVRDMNKDGRQDIVALFGQQSEAVYVFYQTGNLQFRAEKVLQFEPQYGTSDFILLDYNHDGIDDLAVVHGDNADYSYCLKAYHGLRVFLGHSDRTYTEAFFYPIYGATRLQADDFDQDGDIDFAVSSFFPELTTLSSESFVYLENKDSGRFTFTSHVLDTPVPIKSLTLEKADVDQDGDMDLVLGQFSYSPVAVPAKLQRAWNMVDHKLVLLLNQHVR
ncbi:MAG: VCBS repeat-containing protein, partial [Bacteroidetes bacterium]|nr:VCBS repeat-containing protein [Fibrella sp.]